MKTAVLLIGFGGPSSLAEVRPFLQSVLQGVRVPQERVDEVAHHYEIIGGVSPYNLVTYKQKEKLEMELEKRGVPLPVFVGFRHSTPAFSDIFLELKKSNVKKVVGAVLSSFRTYASFEKYQEKINEAQRETNFLDTEIIYTAPFYNHASFINAQSRNIEEALRKIPVADRVKTYFLFLAHSVPVAMSQKSGYAEQFLEASLLIAKKMKLENWSAAYQSRSGHPKDPWLSPDVKDAIKKLDPRRFKNIVLIPVGFLCDNVEVIYDLDIEARGVAENSGLEYWRASTVADDEEFIGMMATLVQKKLRDLP